MTTFALLGFAALTFTILAGVINELSARRHTRRLPGKPTPVLHPLAHHGHHHGRPPRSWRPLHYLGSFLGFLLVTYLGLLLLRALHRAIAY
jgi:hypothetical protein